MEGTDALDALKEMVEKNGDGGVDVSPSGNGSVDPDDLRKVLLLDASEGQNV